MILPGGATIGVFSRGDRSGRRMTLPVIKVLIGVGMPGQIATLPEAFTNDTSSNARTAEPTCTWVSVMTQPKTPRTFSNHDGIGSRPFRHRITAPSLPPLFFVAFVLTA